MRVCHWGLFYSPFSLSCPLSYFSPSFYSEVFFPLSRASQRFMSLEVNWGFPLQQMFSVTSGVSSISVSSESVRVALFIGTCPSQLFTLFYYVIISLGGKKCQAGERGRFSGILSLGNVSESGLTRWWSAIIHTGKAVIDWWRLQLALQLGPSGTDGWVEKFCCWTCVGESLLLLSCETISGGDWRASVKNEFNLVEFYHRRSGNEQFKAERMGWAQWKEVRLTPGLFELLKSGRKWNRRAKVPRGTPLYSAYEVLKFHIEMLLGADFHLFFLNEFHSRFRWK